MTATITAPYDQEIITVSVAKTVLVYAPDDSAVDIYIDGVYLAGATSLGSGNFSYAYTPGSTAATKTITARGNVSGDSLGIPVTVAEANTMNQTMTAWSSSGIAITAAGGGVLDPDGGTSAYKAKATASGTASRYIYYTTTAPTEFKATYAIWFTPIETGVLDTLSVNCSIANCFYDHGTDENTAGHMYSAVIATRTVGGRVWKLLYCQPSTAASAQSTFYNYFCKDTTTNSVNLTAGEVTAESGFYLYKPRFVGTLLVPFRPHQKIAIYYSSVASGVETWYYKHPYANTVANMAGGPGGLTIKVIKPTGWTKTGNYKSLFVLPALLDSTETGIGHDTPVTAVTYQNYADIYNCVIIIPYDRDGFLWWGCHDNGDANMHAFMGQVLPKVAMLFWGIAENRNTRHLLGYSKSAWASHSLMLLYPEQFGFAAGWDSPLDGAWPNNNVVDAFTTEANFNLYDPIQLLTAYGSNNRDRRRLVVMGYEVFLTETNTFTAALDAQGIPYYVRNVDEGVHSWGTTTWVPIAIQELFHLSSVALFSNMFLAT